MRSPQSPLARDDRGPEVGELQDCLHVITGFGEIDPDKDPGEGTFKPDANWRQRFAVERSQQWFGPATELRLKQFQSQRMGARASGQVDTEVERVIEKWLDGNGMLDPKATLTVMGEVSLAGGGPLAGFGVEVEDEDLRRPQQLGAAVTRNTGFYLLRYDKEQFALADGRLGRVADLVVKVRVPGGAVVATGRPSRWPARTVEIVDIVVPRLEPEPSEFEQLEFHVPPLLAGQGARRAEALRPPEFDDLAPHETEPRDLPHLERKSGLAAAWIEAWADAARMQRETLVRLGDQTPERNAVVESMARAFFYGWCRERRQPQLAAVLASDWPEWQRVQQQAEALSRVKQRDWVPLNKVLAWLQRLALVDSAPGPRGPRHRLSRALALTPERPPNNVLVDYVNWLDQNEAGVPVSPDKFIDGLKGADKRSMQGLVRTLRISGLCEDHDDLTRAVDLALAGSDASQSIAPLATWRQADWNSLVARVAKAAGDPDRVAGLGSVGKVARVLQARAEVFAPAQAIAARIGEGGLVLPGFEGFAPEGWFAVLKEQGAAVDQLIQGVGLEDIAPSALHPACRRHLLRLGAFVRLGLGLEVGGWLIDQGITSVGALGSFGGDVIRRQFLSDQPTDLVEGIVEHLQTMADASTAVVESLVAMGGSALHQAREGAHTGGGAFLQQVSQAQTANAGGDGEGSGSIAMTDPTLPGMFGDLSECACLPSESIFGVPAYLVDLLELLKQVPGATPTAGPATARDEFFRRQPHVQHLELGRENAEVELPHIDLALEALEWHAALPRLWVSAPKNGTPQAWFGSTPAPELQQLLGMSCLLPGGPLQCTDLGADRWLVVQGLRRWTLHHEDAGAPTARLRISEMAVRRTDPAAEGFFAEPAHRVPEAYAALAEAVFPFDLPFDRDQVEAEAFEERLGLRAYELVESLPASTALPEEVVLRRLVGLAPTTAAVLLKSPLVGDSLWAHWGFDEQPGAVVYDPDSGEPLSDSPAVVLQRASVLRARTGLELQKLEEALATRYVGELVLVPRDACKASEMRLRRLDGQPPGDAEFDHLQRFVRWWRQVPDWSAALLDSVLISAKGGELQVLADVRRLMDRLGVSPDVALGLMRPLGAVVVHRASADMPATSLFDQVFLSSRIDPASRADFGLLERPGAGVAPSKIEGRLRGALLTATALTDYELQFILEQLQLSADLTEATATLLWRLGKLAGALQEPARDLVTLSLAVGFPWALEPGPDDLLALERLVRTVRASGVPRDRVLRILRLQVDGFPSPEAWAQALREAFPAVHAWPGDEAALRQLALDFMSKFVEPELAEHVLKKIQVAPQVPLDARSVRVLTQGLGSDKRPALFRDEDDLLAMLTRSQAPAERVKSLLDRLQERLAGWQSEVARALSAHLDAPRLEAVAAALRFDPGASLPGEKRREAVAALSRPALDAGRGEQAAALMTEQEAARLLEDLKPGESAGSRLRQMQMRVGLTLRQRKLLRLMQDWTGWSESQTDGLLGERLPLNAQGLLARGLMLSPAFWQAPTALTPEQSRDLGGWWLRVALLKQLEAELGGLLASERWNWFELLDVAKPAPGESWRAVAARRCEVLALLAVGDPNRLGMSTLQEMGPGVDVDALAKRLRIAPADIGALAGGKPSDLFDLCSRAELMRRHGISSAELAALAGADPKARAKVARAALARRVSTAAWNDTLRTVQDGLRKRQRDALVAYLLHHNSAASPVFRRADDLYEHYLIDPQIQPCYPTTRILQAVAAVQLFVQRILGAQEAGVPATDLLRQRWTWMRSYRLWEANRRVFAYPENLLLPELLDRKSEALIKLEGRIRQNELDEDEAREAFADYLSDVAAAGQTVVVGMHDDIDAASGKRRLFVLGRTPNAPYRCFWRVGENFGESTAQWTPWRRIELDIKGEQVAPLVLGGELYVVWVEFASEGDAESRKCQATVRWSRFNGRTWGQPDESSERLTLPIPQGRSERSGYAIRVQPVDGNTANVWLFSTESDAGLRADVPVDYADEPARAAYGTASGSPPLAWRKVGIRAWLRLKTLEGLEVRINRPDVDSRLVVRYTDTSTGQEAVGGHMLSWDSAGDITEHAVWVSLELAGTTFQGTEKKTLRRLSGGKEGQNVALNFEIDLTKSGKTAAELGFPEVDMSSRWVQRATFKLQVGGLGRWDTQAQGKVLAGPPGTQPTQAGYAELSDNSHPVVLTPWTGVAVTAFAAHAPTRFALLAANGEFDLAAWRARTWHVTDGAARRYVDLAASEPLTAAATGSLQPGHEALPDSFVEAQTFRSDWLAKRDLLALQEITFGVDFAPASAASAPAGTWPQTADQEARLAFDERMPYAVYNWEAFLHAPLLVADQLTKQHKFELAEHWLRLVFDPTRSTPREFLRCRALQYVNPSETALSQLSALARSQAGLADSDADAVRELVQQWRDNPYRPFAIARARPVAFLWRVAVAYVENLIAWGDALYRVGADRKLSHF